MCHEPGSFYSRETDVLQERDGWVDCAHLDLKKDLEKVQHKNHFWTVENIGGLKGNIVKRIESRLRGRQM